jgi:hypothetical protein
VVAMAEAMMVSSAMEKRIHESRANVFVWLRERFAQHPM